VPSPSIRPLRALVAAFVAGEIDPASFAREFEATYLRIHDVTWSEQEYAILQELFGYAECFVSDPDMRPRVLMATDESKLRAAATLALSRLKEVG